MGINLVVNRIKMSDGEENEVPQVPEEEEKADNIKDALKMVIKKSAANDGLVKGLNEVCKALDRKQAILCILAEDCNDPKYKKLVDGLAKKVKGTSSIAIKNYGEETEALSFVLNHIKE